MLCRVGDCIVIHTVGFEINDVCCVAKQHHAIEHAGTELALQDQFKSPLAPHRSLLDGFKHFCNPIRPQTSLYFVRGIGKKFAMLFECGRCIFIFPFNVFKNCVNLTAE